MTQVPSDIVIEVDWDNDGDFDEPEEDITSFVMGGNSKTGRDFPSQLTGKAGPGLLSFSLDNTDNRFAYFNTSSPLNTAPFSLKTGRKMRVRTSDAGNPDPALLARDRFRRALGALIAEEGGLAWTNHMSATWQVANEQATVSLVRDDTGAVTASEALATVNVGGVDCYAQVTIPINDGSNQVGLVYRFTNTSNYGAVIWQNQLTTTEVAHFTIVAGVVTETFSSGQIEHQDDTTIGVLVDGTSATVYLNGVAMASGTAYSGAGTRVGLYTDWDEGRLSAVDDFHVWEGLPVETTGILWTGDVSDLTVNVEVGPKRRAELKAEGWLAKLAATDITPPFSVGVSVAPINLYSNGQTTGLLVGKTLAKASMLHPPGFIQRGEVTAGSVGLENGKALDIARQFEELEFGFLYEAQEGPISFDSRTARDASYSLATFSDAPTGDQLGYETIEPFDWRQEVINQVDAGVSATHPIYEYAFGSAAGTAAGVDRDIVIILPTTNVAAGDLFLVVITPTVGPATGQQWTTPVGWTAYNQSDALGRVRIYAKEAVIDDPGASVTFYNDSSTGGAYIWNVFLVKNWYGDIGRGVEIAQPITFTGDEARRGRNETPVIFPSWGREPTLFLAFRSGMGSTSGAAIAGTTGLNGYSDHNASLFNGATDAYDVGFEHTFLHAIRDVENPGSFGGTFSGFNIVENNLVAIRGFSGDPPSTNGVQPVQVNNFASQDAHNAVRNLRNPANLFRSKADARTYGNLVLARYGDDRPIFRIGFTATQSEAHRSQAVERRVGDRITLIADNDTGLNVDGDFHIESIANEWSNGAKLWKVFWELSPAEAIYRADSDGGHELGVGIDSVETVVQIDTISGRPWISSFVRPNMFPIPVMIGTELVRLVSNTANPDNNSPQFYNVERSVNGVVSSHLAGTSISLADPWILP